MLELAVVLDANVYLDVLVARRMLDEHWVPHRGSERPAARRAAARDCVRLFCEEARGGVAPFLYVDEDLDDLVIRKLVDPVAGPGHRGLGWSLDDAVRWYQDTLVAELEAGGRVQEVAPSAAAEPLLGLDYEDSRVLGLLMAARQDPHRDPVLVTNDAEFARLVNASAPVGLSGKQLWWATEPRHLCREVSRRRRQFHAA